MTKICSLTVAVWLLSAYATSAQQASKPPVTPPPAPAPTTASAPAKMPEGSNVNSDAKLMFVFKAKVDDYLKLRKDLEKDAPPLKKTADPKEILAAEKVLAAKVRAARANAKRGDFFTPATQAQFRRLLNPALKGSEGIENKGAIRDDAPEPKDVPFHVNADYPRDESLSTVPPDVLMSLPQLPPDIQYRFVGRHLILYDAKPNIIVDFMLNALPPITPVKR